MMEDLYKYLKPVIGNAADLLALERELKIQKGEILLEPPSEEQASGEIKIGKVSQAGKDMHDFGISHDELTNHCLIAGRTGAGKTNTSLHIIKSLVEQKIPFIIFDWKKTHRNLVSIFPSIKVFTVGRSIAPFYFNPLIPPPDMHPRNWALALSQIWEASSLLGPGASHLLLKAFDYMYNSFGVYENPNTEIYPTMHDLLSYLETLDIKKFREAQWLSSAKRAVQNICFGDAGKALRVRKRSSLVYLEKMFNENIILELETLTHSAKIFFIYSLLLWLHHYNLNTIERGKLKRALIIEECHHLLSKYFRKSTSTEDVLENLLRESREFGTAFIMLFQTVSNIPNTALSNIHTIICHNLVHDQDINAMAGILLLDQRERKYISQLQVGQAIVKLQSRYTKPFLINVPHFNIIRNRILTDFEIRKQDAGFSPNSQRNDNSEKPKEGNSPLSPHAINSEELAFLLSILNMPFLSTALRYKELGFYMKKGNTIKNKLLKLQLIADLPIQISDSKTIKLSYFTLQGKTLLKTLGYSPNYDFETKGGLEHAFWVNYIKSILQDKRYQVRLEHQGIDVLATKDNQAIAIEVETGSSYPAKNILKCIQLGYSEIISVATNQETYAKIKRFITHFNLQEKVTLALAKDLAEYFSKLVT
jgi:hypothetical protein